MTTASVSRNHAFSIFCCRSWLAQPARYFARALFRRKWTRFMSMLIAERKTMGVESGAPRDLFDLMVAARDPETNDAFTDAQLGDQVSTMILAGHETTATASVLGTLFAGARPGRHRRRSPGKRTLLWLSGGAPDLSRLAFHPRCHRRNPEALSTRLLDRACGPWAETWWPECAIARGRHPDGGAVGFASS